MKKWVVFGRLPRFVRVAAVCNTKEEAETTQGIIALDFESDIVRNWYVKEKTMSAAAMQQAEARGVVYCD